MSMPTSQKNTDGRMGLVVCWFMANTLPCPLSEKVPKIPKYFHEYGEFSLKKDQPYFKAFLLLIWEPSSGERAVLTVFLFLSSHD